MSRVRKAVIPAGGYGTRMLPVTKTLPKEMLPIVDKPIIQVVIEELAEAGITDIIIITTPEKHMLVDYFSDVDPGLAEHLRSKAKEQIVADLQAIKNIADITFVEQERYDGLYGTAIPVLNAEPYVRGEPFIYTFADDFFVAKQNNYSQMLEAYEKYQAPVIACQRRTDDGDYDRYGYVGGKELTQTELQVSTIVEHPGKANKPGDLASLGGFVVTPEVLPHLHAVRQNLPAGKEIYFHASLSLTIAEGKRVVAREITDAQYFDTGNKLEYMKTNVALAAAHPEIGRDFTEFLSQFVQNKGETYES